MLSWGIHTVLILKLQIYFYMMQRIRTKPFFLTLILKAALSAHLHYIWIRKCNFFTLPILILRKFETFFANCILFPDLQKNDCILHPFPTYRRGKIIPTVLILKYNLWLAEDLYIHTHSLYLIDMLTNIPFTIDLKVPPFLPTMFFLDITKYFRGTQEHPRRNRFALQQLVWDKDWVWSCCWYCYYL